MVHLFGDWFSDFSVLVVLFIVYVICYIFYIKEKKSRKQAAFALALVGLIITGFSLIGTIIFGDPFEGQAEGFFIFVIVFIVSLITLIVEGIDLLAEKK